ncbi:hydroxysteroid dehydrogenase-like protein 2 isoform X2 [Gadus macrocephalus]|uniref:hydroxysteroid dehydrogenase-like protein 2 isoform X2 n=1 Tax=Gadus macrocephalus TaxID=80720 RepID=UPI0028CB873D|nr:hydroxysteroid dehydrogenase-like protein 2 isoform X2 [Gadus macrocephalus]
MLQNTGALAGRTLFVTGASRGIGRAIALKAARDGANVVVAAKTAEAHPKLPGTIYTAAREIEEAGGKALACVVDVRDEEQIRSAVEQAVAKFGGIDILVNNASAINLTGTLGTSMKKVDLMLAVNLRGTYLTSKLCIPHLLKSSNPHILNLSPPLNLNPIWFKNHTAYTMAKYGMSMCVLGMAEEFRGQISVNALWPKTAIQTAAMDMLGGEGIERQCRKADIMADAAYSVFSRPLAGPAHTTGHFLIDEDILREAGLGDMEVYAVEPGHPLMPDFFLDVETDDTPSSKALPSSTKTSNPIEETFALIRTVLSQDLVQSTKGVYQFDLSGEHTGSWFVDLKQGAGLAGQGLPPSPPDVVMSMDSALFSRMFRGELKPTMAFMTGKLRINGDMTLAIKLEKMMAAMSKSKL